MQRVTSENLSGVLSSASRAVLLFGAPSGAPTMAQAVAFADAWVDLHDSATFGHVDAVADVSLARRFGLRLLPTTVIVENGDIVSRFEGHCSARQIATALAAPFEMRAAA